MKAFLFTSTFWTLAIVALGQNKSSAGVSDCMTLMNRLSENWKQDSIGNNGFRRDNSKYLLSCKQQGLTKNLLLTYLGKPNQIRDTNKGKQFLYYYYDFRTLPKGKDGPLGYAYIVFTVPDGQEFVSNIDEGDADF
jgi:hypothetical protein